MTRTTTFLLALLAVLAVLTASTASPVHDIHDLRVTDDTDVDGDDGLRAGAKKGKGGGKGGKGGGKKYKSPTCWYSPNGDQHCSQCYRKRNGDYWCKKPGECYYDSGLYFCPECPRDPWIDESCNYGPQSSKPKSPAEGFKASKAM
ncbi:hypothetical protein GGF31_000624 [Allomyces arbusculus]|nr:hypothetical protein GGF31_000624 [Allomyces arbusculus]